MDLSYGISSGTISERTLGDGVDGGARSRNRFVFQDQIYREGDSMVTQVPFLPVFQSVSAEGPQFRRAGCDLEPAMANEKEVVRARVEPIEMRRVVPSLWSWIWPNEDPGKYVPKDFWRDASDVQ